MEFGLITSIAANYKVSADLLALPVFRIRLLLIFSPFRVVV